ncbi:MAG: hypothetical protein M3Z37_06890 [Candidatus Eremiobacteraeota bacterium]|nr:hypothetical protein [Candidatus Eremiobacteraeota bacterium]
MHRIIPTASAVCLALVLFVSLASAARAAACDNAQAQALARQGYQDLDRHKWTEAKAVAGSLVQMAQSCDDTGVKVATAVHSAYIGSAAMHGLGDDSHAAEGVKAGLMVLEVIGKSAEYKTLYDQMQPRFIELQRQLKT